MLFGITALSMKWRSRRQCIIRSRPIDLIKHSGRLALDLAFSFFARLNTRRIIAIVWERQNLF